MVRPSLSASSLPSLPFFSAGVRSIGISEIKFISQFGVLFTLAPSEILSSFRGVSRVLGGNFGLPLGLRSPPKILGEVAVGVLRLGGAIDGRTAPIIS